MLSRLRRHLSYANVVSTLCLFILLGGSAYAAAKVGSAQIKNNSIRSKDIRNNSVSGIDVKNGSLSATEFGPGQLPAGAGGPPGPTGPTGPPGAVGQQGATGSPAAGLVTGRSTFCDLCIQFAAPIGKSTSSPTADDVTMVSPARPMVARDLVIARDFTTTQGVVFSLWVNGADTALGCRFENSSPELRCSDTTHAATIPAGSLIALRADSLATGGATNHTGYSFGWRAVAP